MNEGRRRPSTADFPCWQAMPMPFLAFSTARSGV
jgi:hypothetical protein